MLPSKMLTSPPLAPKHKHIFSSKTKISIYLKKIQIYWEKNFSRHINHLLSCLLPTTQPAINQLLVKHTKLALIYCLTVKTAV